MKRRNRYGEQLKARLEAARTGANRTADKPRSEMSEEELDAEEERLRQAIRESSEEMLFLQRQELQKPSRWTPPRKGRRPWK